eukprot:364315-Chlamydomonas_euryale.AAC.3
MGGAQGGNAAGVECPPSPQKHTAFAPRGPSPTAWPVPPSTLALPWWMRSLPLTQERTVAVTRSSLACEGVWTSLWLVQECGPRECTTDFLSSRRGNEAFIAPQLCSSSAALQACRWRPSPPSGRLLAAMAMLSQTPPPALCVAGL